MTIRVWTLRRAVFLAASVGTLVLLPIVAVGAEGQPVPTGRAGDVRIMDPVDTEKALTKGASASRFSLALPAGATCPGDSAHDQYRFQTFLAPASDDPASFRYGGLGPQGNGRQPLFGLDTRGVVNMNLRQNNEAGRPATIPLPTFTFELYPTGIFGNGAYRLGVACSWWGATQKYWDTIIVIAKSSKDRPGGFRWSVPRSGSTATTVASTTGGTSSAVSEPIAEASTSLPAGSINQVVATDPTAGVAGAGASEAPRQSRSTAIVAAVIAVALVAGLVLFWPRRRSTTPTESKDES